MQRTLFRCLALAFCACVSIAAANAQATDPARPLTQGGDLIAMPSLGRVLIVFLFIAALAVIVVAALRRVLPKFTHLPVASGNLRVLNRVNLGAGLRVYTLECGDDTVLLAEGRNGLALTALKKKEAQA